MKQLYRILVIAVALFLALGGLLACGENRNLSPAPTSAPLLTPASPMSPTSPPAPTLEPQRNGLPVSVPDPTASPPAETAPPTPFITATPTPTLAPAPTTPAVEDETQEKLWELKTEFAGIVTPAVVDGIVYVGTQNRMNALDAWSGEILWSFETPEIFWGTPLVTNGSVYFGQPNRQVYALDAQTGAFRWAHATEHDVAHMAVANDVIYLFTEQNRLHALDTSTGESIWSYLLEGETSPPEVGDGVVYLSVGSRLVKLDALTGQELPRIDTGRFFRSLTLADGVLFGLPSFPDQPEPGTAIQALDPATGDVLWASASNADVAASVSVAEGVAYVSHLSGHLSAFDAFTGDLLWRHQVAVENEDFVPPRVSRPSSTVSCTTVPPCAASTPWMQPRATCYGSIKPTPSYRLPPFPTAG